MNLLQELETEIDHMVEVETIKGMIAETEVEIEIGMTVEAIQQTTTGIEVSLTLEMEELEEENIKGLGQVKETLTRMDSVITVT